MREFYRAGGPGVKIHRGFRGRVAVIRVILSWSDVKLA
jgi:hypothetical protein